MMRSWRAPWTVAAGLAVLIMACPPTARSGEIYQWKDAAGVVHFSDNPDDVPAQDRGKSLRDVQPLGGIATQTDTTATGDDDGQKLWESKCQACHVYDSNSTEKGHTGLLRYILNPDTKFPYPDSMIMDSLETGIRGNSEGMPAVDITHVQLKTLVEFLKKAVTTP